MNNNGGSNTSVGIRTAALWGLQNTDQSTRWAIIEPLQFQVWEGN